MFDGLTARRPYPESVDHDLTAGDRSQSAAVRRPLPASEEEPRECLVCRCSDGGFRSREHALPESLGNTEIILPPGVVCDRCNNKQLAVLDQVLCEFMPIKMRRTMLGVRSKAGSVPTTRLDGGTIEHSGPGSLRFEGDGDEPMLRETFRHGDTVGLSLEMRGGNRMTPRYGAQLSRALLKAALEIASLDHGALMFEARFDHVRKAILGGRRFGFVVVGRTGDPDDDSVSLTYDLVQDGSDWRMWVIGRFFGVTLATDSRLPRPTLDMGEVAIVLAFDPHDFGRARPSEDAR